MPTIRNNGTLAKYVGGVLLEPNTTEETIEYPDPADTTLELISDEPIWKLGMTAKPIKDAITTSKEYTVPWGTKTIIIYNKSSNAINAYNAKIAANNFEIIIPPNTVGYIDEVRNRVRKLWLEGTAAVNEVFVSFSTK